MSRDLGPDRIRTAAGAERGDRLRDRDAARRIGRVQRGDHGHGGYLSPEQVESRALGPETDIYSTGLVLLEACTGRPAYPGGVLDSALARLEGDPEIPPHLPAEIAHLLRSMTAREPAHRPTAEAAAQALREWLIRELGGEAPRRADPEAERLAAVRDYDLIGTEPDAEFDRITAFATRVFDVSVAVITVVDEARVWLKSRQGIEVEEIERARGLGASGGLHEDTLIVEDAANDPRVSGGSGTSASAFRFYAGVPLRTPDGHTLGNLAIADAEPRRMSQAEIDTLHDLGAMAVHEMEIRRAARRAAFGNERL
ncbi:MAG: protein kinase [Solirubrobacterales bacterium]